MKAPIYRFLFSSLLLVALSVTVAVGETVCEGAIVDCGTTPEATFDQQGRLWLVSVHQGFLYLQHSDNQAQSFSTPVKVNAAIERIESRGDSRPQIAVDKEGRLFISWVQKTEGKYAGRVRFTRSLDQGKSFDKVRTINTDEGLIGHRFVRMQLDSEGSILLAWLDKRDRVAAKKKGQKYRGTALYSVRSNDHGISFSPNINLANHSCECCRLASTVDAEEGMYLFWRMIFDKNTRDHALLYLPKDQSVEPLLRASYDQWQVDACPHHGPDMEYMNGKLFLTWFSQGDAQSGLMYASYDPQSNRFSPTQSLDASPQASHPQIAGNGKELFQVWKRFNGENTLILSRVSSDQGQSWSKDKVLTQTAGSSDHPRLIRMQNKVYLSWLSADEGYQLLALEH
ncbi:MAG: hypothetical protein P8O75_00970 [Gammaproteobacteria bacterium]|nr:hypothetical protein [Gammaproteobacteria bacterium]